MIGSTRRAEISAFSGQHRTAGRLVAAAVVVAVAAGCAQVGTAPGQSVSGARDLSYIHDRDHAVGCWIYRYASISCLPDTEYKP